MSTPNQQHPFPFPKEYHFPPFFTRQTNLTTHHAQLTKWSTLILSYCRHHRLYKLSISNNKYDSSSSSSSSAKKNTDDLFHNAKLNRRLSLSDIREVIDFMRRDGRAEYVGVSKDGGAAAAAAGKDFAAVGDLVWIYWRTPEEWAALLESWIDETGQKNSVLTLYELTEGEGTRGTEFHGLDQELLLKALNVLVKRGKAQIFGNEDSQGVKFF